MAQTSNNNLSCLPLYESEKEISSNLPWAYGDIFPLRCDKRLLPFFVTRPKTEGYYGSAKITRSVAKGQAFINANNGNIEPGTVPTTVDLYIFTASQLLKIGERYAVWVTDVPYITSITSVAAYSLAWYNANGVFIEGARVGTASTPYEGLIYAPASYSGGAGLQLAVTSNVGITGVEAAVYTPKSFIPPAPTTQQLYDAEGNVYTIYQFKTSVVNVDEQTDLIYYKAENDVLDTLVGTFRLEFATGAEGVTRYSDWFTVGRVPGVRIEWYDVNDTQFEGGYIPYSLGYRNRIWLNTSVGFPEYEIDKEGDERNGTFFMEKGVSRKSYKMSFYAPEYLCDVLRLVPVSDYVKIYDTSRGKEIEYDVDDIDMEVEWQETGNYATVTFTFKTDTVVKNLGKII